MNASNTKATDIQRQGFKKGAKTQSWNSVFMPKMYGCCGFVYLTIYLIYHLQQWILNLKLEKHQVLGTRT